MVFLCVIMNSQEAVKSLQIPEIHSSILYAVMMVLYISGHILLSYNCPHYIEGVTELQITGKNITCVQCHIKEAKPNSLGNAKNPLYIHL